MSAHVPGRRPEWSDLGRGPEALPPGMVNLSDNTNRFGAPPAALAALRAELSPADYPDPYGAPLKRALSAYTGVPAEHLVTGCGSDDVLDCSFRAFGTPGARFAYLVPTFAMAEVFARVNGLVPAPVPLPPDGAFDPGALLACDPAVVYVCDPNNPTGTRLDPDAVRRVIERARGVVVVDEAYAEFAGGTWIGEAQLRERLVVVRTMSKAFGLAGLRIGYAAAAEPLVREIEIARGPYKVSAPAERAAVAALTEGLPWVREHVARTVEYRARLAAALTGMGVPPLPSHTNFLLVPLADAARVAEAMRRDGVLVRHYEALPGVGDALRISVGPWEQLERALAALKGALACA